MRSLNSPNCIYKLVAEATASCSGEAIEVESDDFVDMADEVLGLMSTFKNLLENSCISESYKAA